MNYGLLEVLASFNKYLSQAVTFQTGSIAKSAVSNHIGYAGA